MNQEYRKTKNEIDRFYILVDYLTSLQTGQNNSSSIIECKVKDRDEFDSLLKVMRSNLIIMLYNLVESTVRITMNDYYDNFNSLGNNYLSVAEEIKKTWIKYSATLKNENKIQQKIFELIESAIDKDYYLSLDFKNFHLSGNADLQEIKEILKMHSLDYEEAKFQSYGGSLKSIKDMRNNLAHGNVSFEENGKTLTIADVLTYKNQTYQCLEYFSEVVEKEIILEKAKKLHNRQSGNRHFRAKRIRRKL